MLKHISPESWQHLPVFQSLLHLSSAACEHLLQDVKTPQMQEELCQEQTTILTACHFRPQDVLQTRHAVVCVQVFTQVQEPSAFTAAERICYGINNLKQMCVWKSHFCRKTMTCGS